MKVALKAICNLLMNDPKDSSVACNDDDAGNHESDNEESSFAAAAVDIIQNRAGLQVWIVAKFSWWRWKRNQLKFHLWLLLLHKWLTPNTEERRKLKAVRKQPAKDNHCVDPQLLVDSSINTVMCNHDVPVG